MTSSYSTNDVSRLARISANRVRDYARAGLVGQTETPAVPQQRRYSFDFRDVMVLRMANELLERGIASARVQRVLRAVREQLPESLGPLGERPTRPQMQYSIYKGVVCCATLLCLI